MKSRSLSENSIWLRAALFPPGCTLVSTIKQTSPASPSLPDEKMTRSRADDGILRQTPKPPSIHTSWLRGKAFSVSVRAYLAWFTNRLPWVTTCKVGLAPPSLGAMVTWWGKPHPTKNQPCACYLGLNQALYFAPISTIQRESRSSPCARSTDRSRGYRPATLLHRVGSLRSRISHASWADQRAER